jgi:formylglycine-generating enzyme required for sulfatase activity
VIGILSQLLVLVALGQNAGTKPDPLRPDRSPRFVVVRETPSPGQVVDSIRERILVEGVPWQIEDTQTGYQYVLVPRGRYWAGVTPDDPRAIFASEPDGHRLPETPGRWVELNRPFYIGSRELSRAQALQLGLESGSRPGAREHGSLPWTASGSNEDLARVSQLVTLLDARIPTEVEWEAAARAGHCMRFQWGESLDEGEGCANMNDQTLLDEEKKLNPGLWFGVRTQRTRDFASFRDGFPWLAPVSWDSRANDAGVHDITGNVVELCIAADGQFLTKGGPDAALGRVAARMPVTGHFGLRPVLDVERVFPDMSQRGGHEEEDGLAKARDLAWAVVVESLPSTGSGVSEDNRAAILASGLPWLVMHAKTGISMVLVPPREASDRPFYIARREFSNLAAQRCGLSAAGGFWGTPEKPFLVRDFVACEGALENSGLAPPTVEEWEKAARAGVTTRFPWGDDPADGVGWMNAAGLERRLGPGDRFPFTDPWTGVASILGTREPNAFGLIDVLGNVAEICIADGDRIVLRGGDGMSGPDRCSLDSQEDWDPTTSAPRGVWAGVRPVVRIESRR